MAERKLPVASIQTIAHDVDRFEQHWPRIAAAVEAAAAAGAKLIVAPEGTVPAYLIGTEPLDLALLARAEAHMARIARAFETTIVYGAAHVEDGVVFNTGTVIGPDGVLAGRAEKVLLWHFDERWFARGRRLEPIETPAGRLGVLICADGRIPTLARTLVERGAEILVMPTAWVTSGRDPAVLENAQADFMACVRARENGVPMVAANKAGVEAQCVAYCGKSAIIDAQGAFVARASERDEMTLLGELTLGRQATPSSAPLAWSEAVLDASAARVRFGITPEADEAAATRLARLAGISDVDLMIDAESADTAAGAVPRWGCGTARKAIEVRNGLAFARVDNEAMLDPAVLVPARLSGVDLVAWTLDGPIGPHWQVAFARTRAAELRAYVVVIDRIVSGRAFAVDPDGTVLCGTFDDLRLAQFIYDPARSGSTTVAPRTDVLTGLRAVEALRTPALTP